MRAGDMRNLNGSPSSSSNSRKHNQTQLFGLRMSKYSALAMPEKCISYRHLPELSISWETLAIQAFCSWWKQMGNDHCFSGSESLISCCLLSSSQHSIYKQGNREMFLLSCFSLSYVTPLLVALHRWVQSTSWPWHHATENRLMRQRKRGSLFCREAGSHHLVVVKTVHTELFCFVRAEFHSVLLHVYLISCKNCCPFLLPLDLLLFWNAKSPTVTLQQKPVHFIKWILWLWLCRSFH